MADGKGTQRLCFAAKFRDRLTGLLSRRSSDEILLIAPCHSVHTFGMGYAGAYAVLERRALEKDMSESSDEDRVVSWFEKGDEIELCVRK